MNVITYSPNFAPPHFAARGIPKKHPTRHNGMSHCLHLYVVCLPLPDGAFFFFSLHKAHTFARPDIFFFFVKYGKGLGMQFRWANFSSYLYACASVPIS